MLEIDKSVLNNEDRALEISRSRMERGRSVSESIGSVLKSRISV